MVIRAARYLYLICQGPATEQECWEEASGYSPSTLASNIAALLCAASFARARRDEDTARFLEEYADFLECDTDASLTSLGVALVDIAIAAVQEAPVVFTFVWMDGDRWEGRDYAVVVE